MFNRDFQPVYKKLVTVRPGIRRMTAGNPSPFTFKGTNTWVVGEGRVAIVDPGPALAEHVDSLVWALRYETVSHIVVTHTHRDHSPGAALLQQRLDVPVVGCVSPAFPDGSVLHEDDGGVDDTFSADIRLQDKQVLEDQHWSLEAVHTPGHLGDHLCFAVGGTDWLLSGDHVMGWSTSIISPPGGHMGSYMKSLHRMLERHDQLYLPGHGPEITEPSRFVEFLIKHRIEREQAIIRCIDRGSKTLEAILPGVYADIPVALFPAAARSLAATLEYLVEEQRIEQQIHQDSKAITYSL